MDVDSANGHTTTATQSSPTFLNTRELKSWLHETLKVGKYPHTMDEKTFEERFEAIAHSQFQKDAFAAELHGLAVVRSLGVTSMVQHSVEMQRALQISQWKDLYDLTMQLLDANRLPALRNIHMRMNEYDAIVKGINNEYKHAADRILHDSVEARHIDFQDLRVWLGTKRKLGNSLHMAESTYIGNPSAAEKEIHKLLWHHTSEMRFLEEVWQKIEPDPVNRWLILGAINRVRNNAPISHDSLDEMALDTRRSQDSLEHFVRTFYHGFRSIEAVLRETRPQFDWRLAIFGVCSRAVNRTIDGKPLLENDKTKIIQVLENPHVQKILLSVGGQPMLDAVKGLDALMGLVPDEVMYGDSREFWNAEPRYNRNHFQKTDKKWYSFIKEPKNDFWTTPLVSS